MQLAYIRIKWIGEEQKNNRINTIEDYRVILRKEKDGLQKVLLQTDDDNESRKTIYYVKGNQALIELGDFYAGKGY